MAGINYDPMGAFIGGYNQGTQQQFENKVVTDQAAAQEKEKQRKQLADQFSQQIKQVTDILRNTNDPEQRKAVMKTLEQAKIIYTGPAAQEYGLAPMFGKQIEFTMQTPYEAPASSGSGKKGASPEEKQAAEKANSQYNMDRATNSLGTIDRAMQMLQGGDEEFTNPVTGQKETITGTANDWIPFNSPEGIVGQATKWIDSAPAGRLENLYTQLRSQEAFKELQRLKAASQTGASGLGSTSKPEFEALQQAVSRLNVGLPKRDQLIELDKLKNAYNNLLELAKQYDAEQAGLGYDPGAGLDNVPPVDPSIIQDNANAAARNTAAVNNPAPPMPGLGNVNDAVPGLDGTMPPARTITDTPGIVPDDAMRRMQGTPAPKRLRFDAKGNMIQ